MANTTNTVGDKPSMSMGQLNAMLKQFGIAPDIINSIDQGLKKLDPSAVEREHGASGYVGTVTRANLQQPAATPTQPSVGPPNPNTVKAANAPTGNGFSELKGEFEVVVPSGDKMTGAQFQTYMDARLRNPKQSEVDQAKTFWSARGVQVVKEPTSTSAGEYRIANDRLTTSETSAGNNGTGGNTGSNGNGSGETPTGIPKNIGIPTALTSFMEDGGGVAGKSAMGAALGAVTGTGVVGVMGGVWGLASVSNGGSIAPAGALGVGAVAAGLAGQSGLSMNLRHQMQSIMRQQRTNDVIGMLNNPSIPIEDLLMYFMAFMTDQYDKRLREKMQEMAEQEKLDQRMQMRDKQAQFVGGLASLVPVVGPAIGAIAGQVATTANQVDGSVNGTGKSSTILQAEIQVLTTRWKNLTEMVSNFYKAIADMTGTIIRNFR